MGCPKSWRCVEIEQQVRFGFSMDGVSRFLDGWRPVKDFAYICHDSCFLDSGVPKEPHIHLMIRFNNSVPTTAILARATYAFCSDKVVLEQNLQHIKKWSSAVAYLTHENVKDKVQYSREQVVSNYDFGHDIDTALSDKSARIVSILRHIDSEELREYNVCDFVSVEEYVKYKKQIDNAFEYVYNRKMREVDRKMLVMYVSGPSGSGKTTFAKSYAEKSGFSYVVSSSSNDPMQDYKGQDCLILDDFRPSDWKMNDLLKLLDNHTISSVKSRYHNKYMCYCKCIIITSVVPLLDVWSKLADLNDSLKEPKEQLLRRVNMSADVTTNKIMLTIGSTVLSLDNPSKNLSLHEQDEIAINLAKAVGFQVVEPLPDVRPADDVNAFLEDVQGKQLLLDDELPY